MSAIRQSDQSYMSVSKLRKVSHDQQQNTEIDKKVKGKRKKKKKIEWKKHMPVAVTITMNIKTK